MSLPGGQPWPNGLYQDNIMYLRGAVPSEEVGGDLQRRAEEILGADNVRNELIIDSSVPKVETVIVRLGNSVLFKSGDFDIPPESEPGFVLWAAFLASNPSVTLTVIGHADSRGTPESNQQLALQRAQVAAERITRNGIDLSRVSAISRGADDPVAVNDTQEGRALNRRVEFAVTGLLSA
jgi:outer membrane protein OmpA-like peptidoglycan-associated protein